MKSRTQLKTKTYRCFNISYDTTGEENTDINLELPQELIVDVYYDNEDSSMDEKTLEACIEDYLSDRISELTGFCHNGFEFEEIVR